MSHGPEEIAVAVQRLKTGGLVAFPTETVYGLGADATDSAAIAKVYEIKGRPSTNPLIVHVTDAFMASQYTTHWSADAAALADAFWPGPLSLIVPRGKQIPLLATGGGDRVAFRSPSHPLTLALIEAFGKPLVGPSANPSGRISPTTAEHVRQAFKEEEVYVLDGGACAGGIESTVLDLTVPIPTVLRPGLISAEQIAAVIRKQVDSAGNRASFTIENPSSPLPSPGLLTVHYAPRAAAQLVGSDEIGVALADGGQKVVVLGWSERCSLAPGLVIRMPANAREYAALLYRALRDADAMNPDLIAVEVPPPGENAAEQAIWDAVMDRLRRATAGK